MSERGKRNVAASVKQRLLNLGRERGEEFNFLLTRYAAERFLYRLFRSDYAGDFVLKGAMLFHLTAVNLAHRSTRDIDLLGTGAPELPRLENIFRELCTVKVDDDGLVFDHQSVRAERIRDDKEYEGVRVMVQARMESARISLQVDIGFGDALTPAPERREFVTLLDYPAPELLAYRWETVIAEKFQALVDLGMGNSRMKDFFDLHYLASALSFDGTTLANAIQATFERRSTPLPVEIPIGLSPEFGGDSTKLNQWNAFLGRLGMDRDTTSLNDVIKALRAFLIPPVQSLIQEKAFDMQWPAGGPWQ